MKCDLCKKAELEFEREDKYMISESHVCQDCYCKVLGDFVEKNPIYTPKEAR